MLTPSTRQIRRGREVGTVSTPESLPLHRLLGTNLRRAYLNKCAAMVVLAIVLGLLSRFVSRDVPAGPALVVVGLILLPNVAVAMWPGEAPDVLLAFSIVSDVAAATVGIHFGGGVDMVSGPLLYVGVIGLAGLILSERAAFAASGASCLGYSLLVWMEYRGWLTHLVSYTRPPARQVTTVVMVSLCLFLVTWVVLYAVRELRAQFQRAEDLRTEAISALSHDLKNPLSIIHSYAEMAEAAVPSEHINYLQRIHSSALQALDLVSNVLDATGLQERPITVRSASVQLNEVVEQVANLYRLAAEGRGIRLTTALISQPLLITADPQLLRRAVSNLLSNAIKYTQRNGTVEVATAVLDDAVTVTISDTGCGISPGALDRLFQKYSRVTSGETVEGTGLGLYIVRCIAEAHGGSVEVSSKIGKGSVFNFRLPVQARFA